jgi:CheY-like chemotaxis protein/predicted regulator of Ras-like GTPase activity (Roadblock/LC7/MglB family)
MDAKILVVDRNEAFATMLRDMLVEEGAYDVEVAHAGSDALVRFQKTEFDLTIVDMDLNSQDMDSQTLIQNVRQMQPTMRLMLIPLMGEDLSPEVRQVDIQGTLSKPFFADDLLPRIKEALAKKVAPRPRHEAPSAPVTEATSDVQAVLLDLARETQADAVLLVSTVEGEEGIVAHASTLPEDQMETLAEQSVVTVHAGQAIARLLGRPDAPFKHNMFESDSLRLYIMVLDENVLLLVVTPINTPLGTIRHNMRRARRDLVDLALT